ncbi:MAG TPA: hypothetical protein VF719_09860 [Abditibacteriaceae bacterium]
MQSTFIVKVQPFFVSLVFVLAPALCGQAQTPANKGGVSAPGAGGYTSDYGSDYGVGAARRESRREPVTVIGFKSRTVGGTPKPWAGLRFAELLSHQLQPVMGKAPSTAAVAQMLASQRVRAQDVACPIDDRKVASAPAIVALRSQAAWKNRFPLLVMGDVMLNGEPTGVNSRVTIRLRAVRNVPGFVGPASAIVTVEAAAREWAQLPSRTALALLDEMKIKLTEDERIGFLRDASPLQPAATAERLKAEQQLGDAIAAAIDSQVLQLGPTTAKPAVAPTLVSLRTAAQRGAAAQQLLKPVLRLSPAVTMRDGDAMAQIVRNAQSWKVYVNAVAGTAQRRLRILAARKR